MARWLAQEAELAVTLLYELGEGAPEEALKPGSGMLGHLALGDMPLPTTPACEIGSLLLVERMGHGISLAAYSDSQWYQTHRR